MIAKGLRWTFIEERWCAARVEESVRNSVEVIANLAAEI